MARRKINKRPGGSNAGKYPKVKSFAGPSGGAPSGSYPINTIERGRSALKLAHNAPNPSGIKQAVYRKYPSLKKQKGGPLKQLNNIQYARRGKAVGSILEGGRIKYDTGGETLEQAATKKMLHKDIPDLVDRMHLRDKGYHKNPSYAKSAIKAQLHRTKEDSLFGTTPLEKGTDTYKAIKEIFKEEKKKGTYSKKAYKRKYK